jgi:RNA polymerase sigma factor (sigma-70 family)
MKNAASEDMTDNLAQLSDELLAIRCQLGEADALDALVTRWHQPLWKYVHRLAGDRTVAAELVQDVWLRVLRALPNLRDGARLRSWLFAIAHRVVMDRFREEYRRLPEAVVDVDEIADLDEPEAAADQLEDLQDAMGRLPTTEREVLVLFYLRELTLAQIAEVLGVPVGTVKSRLFRARRLLRHALTHDETHQ